jgi:hypothetical protein
LVVLIGLAAADLRPPRPQPAFATLGKLVVMSQRRKLVVASLGALVLACAGCGSSKHAMSPLELADATTRGAYDGDPAATSRYFDSGLRATVTPRSVAVVSQLMHRYGEYQGITQTAEIAKDVRYDFEAQFSHGSMLVQMRLERDKQTIAAYRIVPNR